MTQLRDSIPVGLYCRNAPTICQEKGSLASQMIYSTHINMYLHFWK